MDWSDISADVDPGEPISMYMPDNEFMEMDEYGAYQDGEFPYSESDYPYQNGEYEEEYMYDDYPYFDDDYYGSISLSELVDQCVFPTMSQTISSIYPLLGLCLVTRLTGHFLTEVVFESRISKGFYHLCSAVCGLVALHIFFQENLIYVVMLALLTYLLLAVTTCKCRGWSGIAVSCVTVVYLVTCELFVVDETEWHRIRGPQMVLSMKTISLAFDLDTCSVGSLPMPWEFAGYALQVGTVVFGPWVSYQEYANVQFQRDRKLDFYWVAKLVWSFVASLVCVVVSSCVVHWLILDTSFIWLLAIRDAQSFRFSHYFVCYISELTTTLSGLGASKSNGDVRWDLSVSKPLQVELPRSLVEVVTNWHLPMHHWLKTYVFKTARPLGTLTAILLTYGASSLLHGLNFQLASVLLSLGFYSYVEFVLRRRLSHVFSACIQAKRCKPDCQHTHTTSHPYVITANIVLGLLTMFHLAYLGLMFDSSSEEDKGYTMEHTLGKWAELGYSSHWVALATYIFYLLI